MFKISKAVLLVALLVAATASFAQVDLGATTQGCCSWVFNTTEQNLAQQFTLNSATTITGISAPGIGLNFSNSDTYTLAITDALTGGNVYWSQTDNVDSPSFSPAGLTLGAGTYYLQGTSGDHIVWYGSNGVSMSVGGSVGAGFWFTSGGNWFNSASTPLMFEITGEDAVPEPGSMFLMGSGLIGLAGALRRKLIA